MARPLARLGTLGHLGVFLTTVAATVALRGGRVALALGLALALAAALHPVALRALRARFTWTFVALLVLSSALWLGTPSVRIGPLGPSAGGALDGVVMSMRAIAVLLAARGLAATTSPGELASLLERVGMKGLGFTLGVAVHLLPALERSAGRTWDTLRMRGGLRRQRRRMLWLAALTLATNALRRAEDVAMAAELRAFDPATRRPAPLRRGRRDLLVVGSLAALVALLATLA